MNNPPLLQNLAFDPVLANVKLIAEAWDAGGLYQVGSFPDWNRWSEWNGKYRDDIRAFLKGDAGLAHTVCDRIAGSVDIYSPRRRENSPSVNFITCHDGFTLYDLYSYNDKHNEANGWGNTDGDDHNLSWNCGIEGETDNENVLQLRHQMIRNAFTLLLMSRGTPMISQGDEFLRTQQGNNNAYCQDNKISWVDWTYLEENKDMMTFVKHLIDIRKKHPILRSQTKPSRSGYPHYSKHGVNAWYLSDMEAERVIGVMFSGRDETGVYDDYSYIAFNSHWDDHIIELPVLPKGYHWQKHVDTAKPTKKSVVKEEHLAVLESTHLEVKGRSVCVLFAHYRSDGNDE
ncbi:hypothetical protein [Halolactibacillus sp. JCM 19043]|nr:hypothetical protein [Halolactibacillus sp. JCM 19043]